MKNEIPEFYNEKDLFGLDKPKITSDIKPNESIEVKAPANVVYAPLSSRIIAYAIDSLIFMFVFYALEDDILDLGGFSAERSTLLTLFICIMYNSLMESSSLQATLGKLFCSIKVIDEHGQRIQFQKALTRTLLKVISVLPLGLGVWSIAYNKEKQSWHDIFSSTFVINSDSSQELEEEPNED